MKKIHILFPVGILSLVLGFSFASANNARFVGSISGEDLAVASVQIKNENEVYREGEDIVVKKISSNGTITIENENGTSTKNENKNGTSTKNEKENDDEDYFTNSTSTTNFEIDGDTERAKENRGELISDAAKVLSGADLHLFVQSLVNKNSDIESISLKEDRVSITRNISTKLFGFIPSSIKETVLVIVWGDGTEQVTITRPWWNFLSKDNDETNIKVEDIENKINNISKGELKMTLDVATKARILSEIQNIFLLNSTASSTISN